MSLTGKDIQTGQADMISENIYNEKSCYMEPVRPQAGKTDRGHRDHTSLRRRSRKRIRKKDRNDLFGNTISAANDRKKHRRQKMLQINTEMTKRAAELRSEIIRKHPLVHCITNRVTITDCANALLAVGASPVMSEDLREVEEMASLGQALVLNIGTLFPDQVEAMILAGKQAKKKGIQVIFDPVGAGATKLRNDVSDRILREVSPDIIRGNMSEIRALYGFEGSTKGVDADVADLITMENAEKAAVIVRELAERTHAVVAATGAVDIISDGRKTVFVANGHEMLCMITGSGCMLTVLTAGFAGAAPDDLLSAVTAAFVLMGISGETAYAETKKEGKGVGTFHTFLIDRLMLTDSAEIAEKAKIYTA